MAARKSKTKKKAPATTKTAIRKNSTQKSSHKKEVAKKSEATTTIDARKSAHKVRAKKKTKAVAKKHADTFSPKNKKKTKGVSAEARYIAIQEAAYYIAERAKWALDPEKCWAKAEKEIAKKFGD